LLSKWPIRNKLLIGIGLLLVIAAILSCSGFRAAYAYRSLVRCLSGRANELPLAATLGRQIGDLRITLSEVRGLRQATDAEEHPPEIDSRKEQQRFLDGMQAIQATLASYRKELENNDEAKSEINESRDEWKTVGKIQDALADFGRINADEDWLLDDSRIAAANETLGHLQNLTLELPSYLHQKIHDLTREFRSQYRGVIILTWITTVCGAVLLGLFIKLFYNWIFRPLKVLVEGSRRVASGEFSHRISLDTSDEIAELADAMNEMTARFQAVRDDLDRQVQERTKQVVRSEQLASVGFLAAGVAHEINNPLASIALCAESLEGRIQEVLEAGRPSPSDASPADSASGAATAGQDHDVIRNYLRMIQNEAFRCKGITERLLDFSRMGDMKRQSTDLRELVQSVIDMVRHLGRYQDKNVVFAPGKPVVAPVNGQELKQVVLNLITNGLDSLSPGGSVRIELDSRQGYAQIVFSDDGCGMTPEVLEHLFEPFFTRRRTGQGIGLGLSITYRIVADHNGQIEVHSDGPGKGSEFRVSLPVADKQKESEHRYQAA